jgi:maltose-binding protein MalE
MVMATIAIPVSAASNGTSTGNKVSISDVSEILNAISYAKYRDSIPSKNVGNAEVTLDIFNYKYEYSGSAPSTDITKDYNGEENTLYIPDKGTVTWSFQIPEGGTGNYTIEIEYCHASNKANSIERIFYINGEVPFSEARSIVLSKVWEYQYLTNEKGEIVYNENGQPMFETDNNGNDVRPTVGIVSDPNKKWVTYAISDSNGYEIHPFQFYFEAGENTISMESQREPVIIKSIKLVPYKDLPSYESYVQQILNKVGGTLESNRVTEQMIKDAINKGSIIIEAEAPDRVSAVTMYPVYDRTSSITSGVTGPQSAMVTKYNTAGKEQWQNVGEWMSYEIEVPESGYYSIAVRYKQALLSGMYVSRKVYIDGELPFAEAANCRFPYSNAWETCYLNDGTTEFEFYLEKGTHEIKLEATLGEMGEQIKKVSESLSNINNCYLEIIKLTGTNPDTNRSYGFTRVMPDVLKVMLLEAQNLESVYNYLVAVNKAQDGGTGEGEKTSTIKQVYQLLEKMATNEGEIPGNLATLKSQIGSLGTWINSAKTQPLQVDYYQLQSIEEDLPKADSNFFQALWFEIKLFFASFVGNNYDEQKTTAENVDEVIEVWVVTGRDQAQIIRNLIENDFTPDTNIGVNIKLIAGGTLLPSIIAGVGPEVSLMEASTTIIDYALRNAIKPLNEYINDDIATYDPASGKDNILEVFPKAAFEPLTLYNFGYGDGYEWAEEDLYLWRDGINYAIDAEGADGKTNQKYGYGWQQKDSDGNVKRSGIELYALPDSLTFSMMFYRKDVLTSLEIELPDTWDDMLSILPILQYNNMEIGIQNDAYTFMYQNGNEAYSNNGMTINFDSKGVLNSFEQMCNYYTQYSLPYTYDFANRFRTGEMPIGISAYTTCNQLSVFASELSGLWTFVRLPGQVVLDENGETLYEEDGITPQINRKAMAAVTGCVMIDNGNSEAQQKKDKAAWEYMRWYTGSEFQADYSNEIVSILGIAARPATANQLALEDLPWTAEEKNNILEQFRSLEAVPNHPGAYYLARYVSFAFLAAYNEGEDASDALLSYVSTINSELTRRRKEFGMLTYDDYMKLNPNGELTSPTVGE